MFILTANLTDTIPSPLLDRMEVINLSGYTEEEKHKIATDYLLPRQIKNNGLTARNIHFSDGAIQQMITEYTLEAGLRNLEREFGTICRKVARKIAEGRKGPYSITQKNLSRYLGPPSFQAELDKDESQVGLVTGLAWTQTGGEVLYVETSMLPGKGELIMTGQLGEVMQESGRAAMSYARANLERLGVDRDIFENYDFSHPCTRGSHPQGRSFRRDCHGNGPDISPDRAGGKQGCGHDGRNFPAGSGPAHRRIEGKGDGCPAGARSLRSSYPKKTAKTSSTFPPMSNVS